MQKAHQAARPDDRGAGRAPAQGWGSRHGLGEGGCYYKSLVVVGAGVILNESLVTEGGVEGLDF